MRLFIKSNQLLILLILGLIHGLIYVYLAPAWQHYDEPSHFEYAWLIANHGGLPKVGDFDPAMRRQVASSMIAHGFYDRLGYVPDLNTNSKPVDIGISQLNDPPLYYLLVSLPLRWMRSVDVASQLYAGRLVSLLLFLATILIAWGLMREITAPGNPLRWMVPLSLVCLPGFVDLMTSMNNDVGAVVVFSLFLWGGVRLVKPPFSVFNLAWSVAAVILGFFTRNTVYVALPLLIIILLFTILVGKWRKFAWGSLAAGVLVVFLLIWGRGDAAYWYRSTLQSEPTQLRTPKAAIGTYALQLETKAQLAPPFVAPVFQPVLSGALQGLEGKPVTIGVWMWASQPGDTISPVFHSGTAAYSQKVHLTDQPTFYAWNAVIASESARAWLDIWPQIQNKIREGTVFYDGFVLAEGERPVDQPPVFNDPDGHNGLWGGVPFTNLIRNASFENNGISPTPQVNQLYARVFPRLSGPSRIFGYLTDWNAFYWHYRLMALSLFRTFWGMFGWGNVILMFANAYRILAGITILGIIGAVWGLWTRRKRLAWDVALIFGISLLVLWGWAFMRGIDQITTIHLYFPVARYAYPVIIPTLLILNLGWLELGRVVARGWAAWKTRRKDRSEQVVQSNSVTDKSLLFLRPFFVVYYIVLIGLDLLSIISIFQYYHPA
jgi:hypothetical protein